jgi:iduronate 2-sulfatase
MIRIVFFLVTAISATSLLAAERLNVLFLMADDLRPEMATYGSPAITPNLDRLAKIGVQFDRAYCQQALCNPSRSSMLTGRRVDALRLWGLKKHFRETLPDVRTLPEWFKQHGYAARCVGKIFHNWQTEVKGDPQSWSAPEFLHFARHGDDKPLVEGGLPPDLATAPRCECRDVPDEAYFDGRVATEAVRVLDEIAGEPFFLAVGFWKPHSPFNAPKRYWDLYDRDKLPALDPSRPAGAPEIAFHDGRELRGSPPNQITFTAEQAAEIRHGYFANVSYMDAQLGKVLDALERRGLMESTVIVFVSDHGYHLGEHDLWAKTSNFELDARVPLVIAAPGRIAGKRSTAVVELLDLFPTLVELCNLPNPGGLEGTSLVPVLNDPAATVKPAAFTQHPRPAYFERTPESMPEAMGYSVRMPQVRYTEWRDWKTGEVIARELYDAAADPGEMHNRIDAPQLAAAQRDAEGRLREQFPRSTP